MKAALLILFLLAFGLQLFSQDIKTEEPKDNKKEKKQKDLPVREAFLSGLLIDNQTTFIPVEKTYEFVIQHKFGPLDNGLNDIFGLYAAGSYIRIGGNYVPAKNLQVGSGLSRLRMYNDFSLKYILL